ncbi:MAG: LptE family protein [candidate division NC10 bacterium]|nr:LptE family protein [candidate division NC10 bacterium]
MPSRPQGMGRESPSIISIRHGLTLRFFLALLSSGLLLWGCGYHFGPASRTMKISTFSNGTFKPGLEILARDLIVQRLREGKVPLVESQGADLILKGTIVGYSAESVAFDVRDISRQYRLTISLSVSLREGAKEKAIWEEVLTASSYYYTGPNVAATEISERKASTQALEELARMVTSRLIEVF